MGLFSAAAKIGIGKSESDLSWSRTKRMMQNRHQWEVADLRKAGLNPILSAGAAPSMGSPPKGITPEFASDEQASNTKRQNKAQRNLMKGQRAKIASDIGVNAAQVGKLEADTRMADYNGILAQMAIPGAALKASIDSSHMGQLAAKSAIWTPHISAGAQTVGALALMLRGIFGGAARTTAQPQTYYQMLQKK